MTLNCKVGDLAIVVRSEAGNEGKIVRCVQLLGKKNVLLRDGGAIASWVWEIDSLLPSWSGAVSNQVEDCLLRPIRPLDEPETTTTDDEVVA
jgi:hypothetical protein